MADNVYEENTPYNVVCVDHAGTTLRQNIIYSMFSRYVWDKNYLCNVGPERTDIFSQKNRS